MISYQYNRRMTSISVQNGDQSFTAILAENYPFEASNEHPINLTCILLAEQSICRSIGIVHCGYRYAKNYKGEEKLVYIVLDFKEEPNNEQQQFQMKKGKGSSQTFKASFNFVFWVGGIQKKFQIINKPLIFSNKSTLPSFQTCNELRIYINTEDNIFESLLQQQIPYESFIVESGVYFIDPKCLKVDRNSYSLRQKIEINKMRCDKVNKHYLRIYIESISEKGQIYQMPTIFQNKKTKLSFIRQKEHPRIQIKVLSVSQTHKQIFQEIQEYRNIKFELQSAIKDSFKIMFLQTSPGFGFHRFLSTLVNAPNIFSHFNCQSLPSNREFNALLSSLRVLPQGIIFLQNFEWVLQLQQAQGRRQQFRDLSRSIQQKIKEIMIGKSTIVVLGYSGQESYAPIAALHLKFSLSKESKEKAIRTVIAQSNLCMVDKHEQDSILQVVKGKIGWEELYQFVQDTYDQKTEFENGQTLKQIQLDLLHQQKVQSIVAVSWDDVGGLETAKQQIIQTVLLPIQHPEIFDGLIKPRTGLLFYGPPGTGKTLLGKCVAKECKMGFISVKGPQLLNMFVGESQKNVRKIFDRAKASAPCIVFMDELDALIPKRGGNADSNQVMDRIVAQLLMEMDKAAQNGIFLIGATNRPDLLDPSVMRPGRFDKQVYLGIASSPEDRIKILKAQTRHIPLIQNFDFSRICDLLPASFTGADFYGLVSRAAMVAAQRSIDEYQRGHHQQKVMLKQVDFQQVASSIKPSVSAEDLKRYQNLKLIYS